MKTTIVNDLPIVGEFSIIRNGKVVCSNADDYSPEVAIMEVRNVYASGDELIVEVY